MSKDKSKSYDLEIEYQDKRILIDLDLKEWIIVGIVAIILALLLR